MQFRILPKSPKETAFLLCLLAILLAIITFILLPKFYPSECGGCDNPPLVNRARMANIYLWMTAALSSGNPDLIEKKFQDYLQRGYTVNAALSAFLMSEYADNENRSLADFTEDEAMKMSCINGRYYLIDANQQPFDMKYENGTITITSENLPSLTIPLKPEIWKNRQSSSAPSL